MKIPICLDEFYNDKIFATEKIKVLANENKIQLFLVTDHFFFYAMDTVSEIKDGLRLVKIVFPNILEK